MNIRRHSENYNFLADTQSGVTFRWGKDWNEDPQCAPWPELADISISNHCSKACTFCYRNSRPDGSFISVDDYSQILDQLTHPEWGSVFQVALGGGEPLEHPDFLKIIEETSRRGIVANFTTNGDNLTDDIAGSLAGKVGAVAVSVMDFKEESLNNTSILIKQEIRTNLHFILNSETISLATMFLKGYFDNRLNGINAVVFLTYKSAGRADKDKCLIPDPSLDEFLFWVSQPKTKVRFGFDACFVPQILRKTKLEPLWVDSCECSFFSVYVDEKLNVKPCSFSTDPRFVFNLHEYDFQYIWAKGFEKYRNTLFENPCLLNCEKKIFCRGNCLFFPELALCRDEDILECNSITPSLLMKGE